MKKQLVAALAAVILAVGGVFSLISYAQGADERAFQGTKMVAVLQVQTDIPAGTPVDRVQASLKIVEIPAVSVVDGALTSLDSVKGSETNASLVKGEQVLASRFGSSDPETTQPEMPAGFQEVSIVISAPRLATGKLAAGDRVGVLASYDTEADSPAVTNFALQRVLVTRVDQSTLTDQAGGAAPGFLVTFALETLDAAKLVNASEFGTVWLTLQNDKTKTGGGRRTVAEGVI